MAILRISRQKEFKSSTREIKIEVNGREIGSVKNGETKDFELAPGKQYIKATLDSLCTSNAIDIVTVDNEILHFRLSHKSGMALFNMIFYSKQYFILEKIN